MHTTCACRVVEFLSGLRMGCCSCVSMGLPFAVSRTACAALWWLLWPGPVVALQVLV